jgi:predicted lactoylglutathione lyase
VSIPAILVRRCQEQAGNGPEMIPPLLPAASIHPSLSTAGAIAMTTHAQLFVNLPVKNLDRSVEFYTKLGYTFNPKFTDENATCMIVGENIFVMLLVEPFFQSFTKKTVVDASKQVETLVAVSLPNRAEVDALADKAVAAGATAHEPKDYGFMYQRSYDDLDGHTWEVFYMDADADPSAAQQ